MQNAVTTLVDSIGEPVTPLLQRDAGRTSVTIVASVSAGRPPAVAACWAALDAGYARWQVPAGPCDRLGLVRTDRRCRCYAQQAAVPTGRCTCRRDRRTLSAPP